MAHHQLPATAATPAPAPPGYTAHLGGPWGVVEGCQSIRQRFQAQEAVAGVGSTLGVESNPGEDGEAEKSSDSPAGGLVYNLQAVARHLPQKVGALFAAPHR